MIDAIAQGETLVRLCSISVLLFVLIGSAHAQSPPSIATPKPAPAQETSHPRVALPAATPAAVPVKAAVITPSATPVPIKPLSAPTASIRGQMSLTSGGRSLRNEEAVDAVVYYRPAGPVSAPAPSGTYVVATERKTFTPRVLPVPVGASVRFPNMDPILHNVFSTAKEANFDLGLYGRGDGESYVFTQPGVIRVFCNVHHSMVANLLVMDTPYFVKPDAQGRFRLSNLPLGPGEIFVWHERAQLWRKAIDITGDQDMPVALELSKCKVPPHLNKSGQAYRRARSDEY